MLGSFVRNGLLRALPILELTRLRPHLEHVTIAGGMRVETAFEPVTNAYFFATGFLSCVAGDRGRDQIEVALVGREGMSGLAAVLGAGTTPFHLVAQRGGDAYRASVPALQAACRESPALLGILMRYVHAVTVQIAETGRANARQTVEARLARWLLMAHDRIDGNEIELTHESLSQILGVRRPGITVALHMLEGERMIRARRGVVEIVDRAKLEGSASGSYGLPEREYQRLLGTEAIDRAAG